MARLLGLIAFLFSILIAYELRAIGTNRPASAAPMSRPVAEAALPPTTTTNESTANRERLVAAILRRPLFSPDRRHATVPATKGAGLPRLAGIIVTSSSRRALFAALDGHGPVVLEEGGRLGPYMMESIEAGQITIDGPFGRLVLRPAFAETSGEQGEISALITPSRPPPRPPQPWGPARSR